jgi:hypothetical protein
LISSAEAIATRHAQETYRRQFIAKGLMPKKPNTHGTHRGMHTRYTHKRYTYRVHHTHTRYAYKEDDAND